MFKSTYYKFMRYTFIYHALFRIAMPEAFLLWTTYQLCHYEYSIVEASKLATQHQNAHLHTLQNEATVVLLNYCHAHPLETICEEMCTNTYKIEVDFVGTKEKRHNREVFLKSVGANWFEHSSWGICLNIFLIFPAITFLVGNIVFFPILQVSYFQWRYRNHWMRYDKLYREALLVEYEGILKERVCDDVCGVILGFLRE